MYTYEYLRGGRDVVAVMCGFSLIVMGCNSSDPENAPETEIPETAIEECKIVSDTAVAWTESTVLGVPKEVFSHMAGSCEAPFKWDASGVYSITSKYPITVTPEAGESTLTATLVLDEFSVRLIKREVNSNVSGGALNCQTTLEVAGTVDLETPQGKVAQDQPVAIVTSEGVEAENIRFGIDENDFKDWISVIPENEQATLFMSFEMKLLDSGCAGEIILSEVLGNESEGFSGVFASWTDIDESGG